MKILTVVGARPQFVKAAAVSRAIRKSSGINEILVHTGQHFDSNMSDVFFKEMEIPEPHFHLGINNLSHGAMTGRMIEAIENVLFTEKPDILMVYGDTNSTLAGALAARKLNIRIAHVEAGLRSFNMLMPEEINRILTDRISDILFCPTQNAIANLENEGFRNFNCHIESVGDVMYDAALFYGERSSERSVILRELGLKKDEFALCTIHRQENTDDPANIRSIIEALNVINKTIRIVLPIHPRTRKILQNIGIMPEFPTIDPVGYFDVVELMKHCRLILTDSGGMQKEAYFFDKYCITLRKETEWIELVQNGYNFLAGFDKNLILKLFRENLNKPFSKSQSLYGNGDASEKIVDILEKLGRY